jgi:hypothetical protein
MLNTFLSTDLAICRRRRVRTGDLHAQDKGCKE